MKQYKTSANRGRVIKIKQEALLKRSRSIKKKKEPFISNRDKQILWYLCNELTSKEIGKLIGLSNKTIDNIMTLLLRKTRSKTRIGLVKYAILNQIYIFEGYARTKYLRKNKKKTS